MKLPGGRKALLLLVPVLLAGGGFGYMQVSASGTTTAPVLIPDPTPGQVGPLLALDSRVINLKTGGAYHYAKIAVTIELRPADKSFYTITGDARPAAEKLVIAAHAADVPMLLDTVGQVVAAKTSDDLNSAAGRAALKNELLASMRGALGQDAVLDIYLTDFVMQ